MAESTGLYAIKEKQRIIDKQRKIKIDLSKTEYPLIRNVAVNDVGWKIWGKQNQKGDANLIWNDTYVTQQFVKRLKPYQRVNHFPNSSQLGKKNYLSQNLKRMKAFIPEQYDFFPETWSIPQQLDLLKNKYTERQQQEKNKNWYIVKPTSGSQGKGIYLTKQINSLPKEGCIVQQYICSPCLIENYKFDLRYYVLIKSLIPLKVFIFDEGLGRLATCEYQNPSKSNKNNLNMHLTNYAINKNNPNYIPNKNIQNDDQGHKRSLSAIFKSLQKQVQNGNIQKLQSEINQIIMKTILAVYPKLLENYKSCRDCDIQSESVCFQILGFDILIDSDLKPWIIEVNHSPSFCTDSPLDHLIKKYLILDTFVLLNLNGEDKQYFLKNKSKEPSGTYKDKEFLKLKRSSQIAYENKHIGGFQRLYPNHEKIVYYTILKKMFQRKSKKKVFKEKQDANEIKALQSSQVYRKTTQILTLYGHFAHKKKHSQDFRIKKDQKLIKNESQEELHMKREEESIKKHVFLEKDKKKMIEPIKMNNVNISFFQKNSIKTFYNSAGKNTPFKQVMFANRSELESRNIVSETKTSQGQRKQQIARRIDSEIKSRVSKMKLARIKLQKIKNIDKKANHQSGVHRQICLANLRGNEYRRG